MHWWFPEVFFCHQTWGRLLSQTEVPWEKNLGNSHLLVFLPIFLGLEAVGLYVQTSCVPRELSGEGFATQKTMSRAGLGFFAEMRLPRKKPICPNQSTSQMYIGYYKYHKQKNNQTNKKSKPIRFPPAGLMSFWETWISKVCSCATCSV